MKRVGLVRTLKGVVAFLAVMVAVYYAAIFPSRIREIGLEEPELAWLVTPGIIAISLSAVPIALALVLFWKICTEIGRDNSFCHQNARWLSGIGVCALIDTGYCAVGTVTLEIIAGSPIWLLGTAVCVAGLAIALAAFLLSHLVLKAADLKSENDLTI